MLLFVILLVVIVPITNFIHEWGHILLARWLKVTGTMLELGVGPKIFSFRLLGCQCQINAVYFLGAQSFNESDEEVSNWNKGLIALGGPFGNLLIAFLLSVSITNEDKIIWLFMLFNFWVGFVNLLPFKLFKKESDGFVFTKMLFLEMKWLGKK
jgi:membrane-associated protease RseP (regulator of RpoE activity)